MLLVNVPYYSSNCPGNHTAAINITSNMADSYPSLRALLASKSTEAFRYGPDKPLVVLRSHWPIDRALKVLLKHNITAAVSCRHV